MTTLLEKLAAEGVLRCPSCRAALRVSPPAAQCTGCARAFSLENGALDLYGEYSALAGVPAVDPGFCRRVADALRFPRDPAVQARVARAVSASALAASDPAYTAEIAELADRLGIAAPPSAANPAAPASAANTQLRVRVEQTYIESHLPAGQMLMRTLRIRSLGPSRLSSEATPPLHLAYHWLDAQGAVVVWDGRRTRLPVDIAPGAALSVIAQIDTPPQAGNYILRFAMVVEGVQWVDIEGGDLPLAIGGEPRSTLGVGQTGCNYDYAQDHIVGAAMVAQHLEARRSGPHPRVLEVGGGVHPQASALVPSGCEAVSVDISFCQAQLGALYFDHVETSKGPGLAFVTCDAHAPPFAAASFDCAIMFAALHHFAEPARMLRALAEAVKPDGFIGVMCEPCVPGPTSGEYLRDLRKGINEQIWTLQEYGVIFERAGLQAVAGHVDGASLKVILDRLPASAG